jgi:DNA-binding phage protein
MTAEVAASMPAITSEIAADLPSVGTAVFANGGPHEGDFFSAAATYIGITVDQLRTEMGTTKSMADVAAAHGKTRDGLIQALTTADAQRIAQVVDQKGAPQGHGPGGPGFGRFPGGPHLTGDPFAAAATYLGTTTADLRTKLESGQTLAQIANATPGKSRDGLTKALVDDATAKIDAAQQAGTITADQATRLKTDLPQRIATLVDNARPGPRR